MFFFTFKIFNRTLIYLKNFYISLLVILIAIKESLYTMHLILLIIRLVIKFNIDPGSNNIRYILIKFTDLYNVIRPYI